MFVSQIFEECAEILGTTDENKIFRKIQQAVATLMESGHWTHSVADVDVCTGWDKCSVTLPRGIDVPLAVNIDGSPTSNPYNISVDRINSSIGYTKDNIQLVCVCVNHMKWDLDEKIFLDICETIYKCKINNKSI